MVPLICHEKTWKDISNPNSIFYSGHVNTKWFFMNFDNQTESINVHLIRSTCILSISDKFKCAW